MVVNEFCPVFDKTLWGIGNRWLFKNKMTKSVYIIAGPNGSGKTTFATIFYLIMLSVRTL